MFNRFKMYFGYCQQEQIAKKVEDVLSKTPLHIKPRRELPRIGKFQNITMPPLVDLETSPERASIPLEPTSETVKTQHIEPTVTVQEENFEKLNILGFEVIEKRSPSNSPQTFDQNWEMKQTNSMELLTPSPLGFTPFDSRSVDELLTPEEFGSDNLAPGLSNINYDIDLSDLSAENSVAEDAPSKTGSKDQFSPECLKVFDPFAPNTSKDPYSTVLETFDEFSLVDSRVKESDPFEVVHRGDPFSTPQAKGSDGGGSSSILDDGDSPTAVCLLPSPLQPQTSGKTD